MAITAGEYEIGPESGRLTLRTYRQGVASRVGHDLLVEAAEWEGRITVPEDSAAQAEVSVRVDLGALRIAEGTGGVKPLSDRDKQQIQKNMHKMLGIDRHRHATFASTLVEIDGRGGIVEGELTLVGQVHSLRLEVTRQNEREVAGTASVLQSRWGITPYSGFLGALRLRDAVDVEFTFALRAD
jgi:polyisoprenoid-binding protein YceI